MIGFMFSDWLHSHKVNCYQTIHTYNALYVSVSGGFSVPCMVIDSIMSPCNGLLYWVFWSHDQIHMHVVWIPTWVCFQQWSTKHFSWLTEHFTTWLCLHLIPTCGYFTLSQSGFIRFHGMSTRHMAIRKVFHLLEESVRKTSNRQHPSVVSTPTDVLLYSSML